LSSFAVELHFPEEWDGSGYTIDPYDCYRVFLCLLALRQLHFSNHFLLVYPNRTDWVIQLLIDRSLVVDQVAVEQNKLLIQGQDYQEDRFCRRSASDLIYTGVKVLVAARDESMASAGGKL
jgi:hypothetical protein